MDDYDQDVAEFERKIKQDAARTAALRLLVMTVFSVIFVFIVGILIANATPNPETAINAVEKAGFSNARVVESGVVTFRCAGSDSYYYRVRDTNPKGDPTEVTVCCGILKDCTVRY